LIRSSGLEPTRFEKRLKLLLLSRFIPFVEKNFNFIELGPRGTGQRRAARSQVCSRLLHPDGEYGKEDLQT
jgi:predicted ATP-dependent Lon-type protease